MFAAVPADGLGLLKAVVVCGADDLPGGWEGSAAAAQLALKIPRVVDWDAFLGPSMVQ